MKKNDVYGDAASTRILVKEFIEGHEEELTPKHAQKVKKMKESFGSYSFLQWSRQKCKDLFISVSFRGEIDNSLELESVASAVIQANRRLRFEDDLRFGGLLYCVLQRPH